MTCNGRIHTPVLQSQSSAAAGSRAACLAVISSVKKKNFFNVNVKNRNELQIELPLLSLAAAEQELREMESGSAMLFVHSEPLQPAPGRSGASSSSQKLHHMYISFKYRTSIFHYAYFWVHLKLERREQHQRRCLFQVEQKHFEVVLDLHDNFIPTMCSWLSAIVSAANFVDTPVESVDLQAYLRARHHLILTRRTAKTASVVLCKLDDAKKIAFSSIDFDFKSRRVRDHRGDSLRNFQDTFHQFLGLVHVKALMPSPREEDEEDPLAISLLEGLQADACPKMKLRKLLRLQGIVRQERSSQRNSETKPELLELWITILLPQLMDSTSRTFGNTPRVGGSSSGESMLGESSATGAEPVLAARDFALEAPFTEIQVLVCDILADLCDFNVSSVGPHVWRMCKGYLEESSNWHACLAALELLTLMSKKLAEWLVQSTDAGMLLFEVVVEAQQLLAKQQENAVAASGRASQQGPPRIGQARTDSYVPSSSSTAGASRRGMESSGSSYTERESRRGVFPDQDCSAYDHVPSTSSRFAEAVQRRDRSRSGTVCPGVEWSGPRLLGHPARARALHRIPSFDNFEGGCADDNGGLGCNHLGFGDESAPLGRRRMGDLPPHESGTGIGFAIAGESCRADSRNSRPVRVPPLNLNLATKIPGAGGVSPFNLKATSQEGASSMTRSSRRFRLQEMRNALPPQPPGTYGTSSRSSGSSRLTGAHTVSAPALGLRSLLGCFSSSPMHSTPTVPPVQQVGVFKASSQFAPIMEKQANHQAEELCRTLGEACLLADLSHILKFKQERNVHEALIERERSNLTSPCKPISGLSRAGTSSGVNRSASSSGLAVLSPKTLASSDSATSLRIAARPQVPGSVPQPTTGASGSFVANTYSHTPDLRQARLTAFRRVRLHACLVLEQFCGCTQDPARMLGQYVPVDKFFEMLHFSGSKFGGCSFTIDDDADVDNAIGVSSGFMNGDASESRQPRGVLQQRLCPWRLQRVLHLQDRLQRSAAGRRCVCGAAAVSSRGAPEDLCTCVDDVLATCIWRFLRVHAVHVEALQTLKVQVPCFPSSEENGVPDVMQWERRPINWNTRLCLDTFLVRIQRSLVNVLLQLRNAHGATNAGPEIIALLQYRLAFVLRLCCSYTRLCSTRVLAMQVFQTVVTPLLAVKGYLCGCKDVEQASQLQASALSLWVAYLQLVGTIIRGARNCGTVGPAFGETLLVQLLDFAPSSVSASANPAPPSSCSTPPAPPPGSAAAPRAGAISPTPARNGGQASRPMAMSRSASLRTLSGGSGAPPRLPVTGSTATSPRTAERSASKPHSTARGASSSVHELLPKILERVLCGTSLDDALAAKPKTAGGEESANVVRCRVLVFIESLLDFAQSLASNRPNASQCTGQDAGDVSGDGNTERMERSMQLSNCLKTSGTLGANEGFRASMAATSSSLLRGLLDWLQFLFLPPSGLLCRLGRTWERTPLEGGKLVTRLVLCERALFQVPAVAEAVYVGDSNVADYYVRRHFLLFVRLYNSNKGEGVAHAIPSAQLVRLCCLHLQTLLAIASLRSEAEGPRRAFHQLSVLNFLAGEVDLEHDTTQMPQRFLRGVQQRQMSRASAGSSSSAGSCASSPSNPPGARFSQSGPLPLQQYLQSVQQTPSVPPLPSGTSQEDKGCQGDGAILTPTDVALPEVVHAAPAPIMASTAAAPNPPPIIFQAPSKSRVPMLKFAGIRPSLQGCSGIGAPPAEEPGQPPYPGEQPAQAVPALNGSAQGSPLNGVPKLSFAGLSECDQGTVGSVLAPVDEPGGSGTGSTVASPGATLVFEDQAAQGSTVETSGEWTEAEAQILFEVAYSDDWLSVLEAKLEDFGIVAEADKQRLLVIDRNGDKVECFSDKQEHLMCERFPLQCKEVDGAPSSEAPRRQPPVVPKLQIGNHTMSGVAAPETTAAEGDPDSTIAAATTPTTGFNSGCGSARRNALGSGNTKAGAPPPPTSGSIVKPALAVAFRPPGAPPVPQTLAAAAVPPPLASQAPNADAPALPIEPDSSDDSSGDDMPPAPPAAPSRPVVPALPSAAPVALAASPVQMQQVLPPSHIAPAAPQLPPPIQAASRIPPPFPSTGFGNRSNSKVPKLTFGGLRPSLQGCSGLGAPPPEEPGMPEQPVAEPMTTQSAPLSPPPPSCSDSDSSSPAPTPCKILASEPQDQQGGDGADTSDSSPEGKACEVTPQFVAGGMPAVQEPPLECDDSSDEDDDDLHPPPLMSNVASAPAPPPLAPPGVVPEADCDPGPTDESPALPPMPDLDSNSPMVGGYQMRGAMPGLPGAVGASTLRQTPPLAAGIPKLSFPKGLRPSLQGCGCVGAPPAEEPVPGADAAGPRAAAKGSAAPQPGMLPLHTVGEPTEPASTTPTGSGYQSPMAGSVASAPTGVGNTDLSTFGVVNQTIFYFEGRQRRRIYEDPELHSLMLTLIIALLLTPKRSLLDSRYTDQYPLASHKRNVPFLLSSHLNHSANRPVLPWLSQQVESISHLGGLRLLKLLCETAMHRWMYSNQERLASGQFGTVYKAQVQFSEPHTVAVKQIPKQTSIQDRCVFADVFSEIACLDAIRYEGNCCQLYDYGVDESGYWIVMKYYATTLKKWREALPGSMDDNLPKLLCVYKQILKAIHALHRHGVIHYDLKCDNIMIDPDRALDGDPMGISIPEAGAGPCESSIHGGSEPSPGRRSSRDDHIPCIAVADFGESRMMAHADDLCKRNRGTEVIKCPEMLEVEKAGRKEGLHYDRRRGVGTNQAADVWSLGCLLFELLTGRFLFIDDDLSTFYVRITGLGGGAELPLITEENMRLLEGNMPLVDFIRYCIQRNPLCRPSIAAVVNKFDHAAAEALRCTNRHSEELPYAKLTGRRDSTNSLDSPHSVARSIGGSSGGGVRRELPRPERPLICAAFGDADSYFTKVFSDLCVLEVSNEDLLLLADGVSDVQVNTAADSVSNGSCAVGTLRPLLGQFLWTHIVDFRFPGSPQLPCQPEVHYILQLPWTSPSRSAEDFLRFLPTIFDFLRHAAITRGVVLLVDGCAKESRPTVGFAEASTANPAPASATQGVAALGTAPGGSSSVGASSAGHNGLAIASLLALVVETYHMAVFPALSHLSSQLLIAAIRPDVVCAMAHWQESERHINWRRCESASRVACLCGSCSWHIPSAWLAAAPAAVATPCHGDLGSGQAWPGPHARAVSCACSAQTPASRRCPNHGHCASYLRWLRARFGVGAGSVRWLWLPEGVGSLDYSDGEANGILTRGLQHQAEPVAEPRRHPDDTGARIQRFRCRTCQVLTHAEVHSPGSDLPRVALVSSYECLRWAAAFGSDPKASGGATTGSAAAACGSSSLGGGHPPSCFRNARLEEVMLPRAQPSWQNLV